MPGTHKYTWEKRQIDIPDGHSRVYNKIPVVNLKGHQSSGARAPELWCPHNLFGVFLVVYPQCYWQYSDITRKRQEHINTLGIKDKLIILMFILEITIKNPVVNLKGHQTSGAPTIFCCIFFVAYSHFNWQCSDKIRQCQEHINTLRRKR